MSRLLIFLFLISIAHTAMADPVQDLRARVGALEQQIKEFQAAVREKGTTDANVATQSDQVRMDFQGIQGSIDAVASQFRMYQEEINRFRQDVDQRLRTMEEQMQLGGRPAVGGATTPAPSVTAAAAPAGGDESAMYQKALNYVYSGDYLNGSGAFKQFIQTHPKSALAPNAQFWAGECSFAMKDYQKAIKEYQIVVERYPRHEKANAAMLKQGLAFESIGMLEEAKLFLQKLVAKAPSSPEARKAAERLKTLDAAKGKPTNAGTGAPRVTPPPTAQPKVTIPTNANSHPVIPLAPGVKEESLRQVAPITATSTSPAIPEGGTR